MFHPGKEIFETLRLNTAEAEGITLRGAVFYNNRIYNSCWVSQRNEELT